MNSKVAAWSSKNSSDWMVIVRAGLACGVMDIIAALLVYGRVHGVRPIQLLQGIASGLLGRPAYRGGIATALTGLWLHFIIAFSAAAAYFAQSRRVAFLLEHAEVSGVLYGIAFNFFTQQIVALSATQKHPFALKLMLIGVVIHIFCVGLPIALVVRRYASR